MFRGKVIKKRTKNRLTLINNLRKGKARLEARCPFQHIPQPEKALFPAEIHHLYGDIVLMEFENKIVTEPSMLNKFKVFKQAHITEIYGQTVVKVMLENKEVPLTNWRELVQRLELSGIPEKIEWANLIKGFCERYEITLERMAVDHDENVPNSVMNLLKQVNINTEKFRQNLFKNYPCSELKSQFKNGEIRLTELLYNDKWNAEYGNTAEEFANIIVQTKGLPQFVKLESDSCTTIAKWRLEQYTSIHTDGIQSPEVEAVMLLKHGFVKRVKMRFHYHATYEKGVPGFSIFVAIVAKKVPVLENEKPECPENKPYTEMMLHNEEEAAKFLAAYYNTSVRQPYSSLDKVCKIKEIQI